MLALEGCVRLPRFRISRQYGSLPRDRGDMRSSTFQCTRERRPTTTGIMIVLVIAVYPGTYELGGNHSAMVSSLNPHCRNSYAGNESVISLSAQ